MHLCKQELTFNADDSLLFHGTQLVLPASLRQRAIEIADEGHQGMAKIGKLLREMVWFPGINRMIETMLKSCIPCQATVRTSPKSQEPLQMAKLPSGSWQRAKLPSGPRSSLHVWFMSSPLWAFRVSFVKGEYCRTL